VKKNTPIRSINMIWIICIILIGTGIALATHALFTFDKADVIVEWTTASELDTVGFNLLRGETPAGPFEQVNPELIPATSDSLTGSSYSYEDGSVRASVIYFYMLEEIESTGRSNQHGPIAVEAGSPAKIELLTAAFLICGATIYAIVLLREPKNRESSSTPL
jgi:hypothetical protein